MTRPVVLDLFSGAGGAGEGYRRAGFDVVGVDIEPHDYRPGRFILGDAVDYLRALTWRPSLVHASPPCQRWSLMTANPENHPDLIAPTRELCLALGVPYVIENVPAAPLRAPFTLCGSTFGLRVRRHRVFEASWFVFGLPGCDHDRQGIPVGVYGDHPEQKEHIRADGSGTSRGVKARDVEEARDAMGIDWPMPWVDVKEAIPPAYTEWIGREFLHHQENAA